METGWKVFGIYVAAAILVCVLFVVSVDCHVDTKDTTIVNTDIKSYVVDNNLIIITTNNGEVYEIKISNSDKYIDFTVNSELYIKLYQVDQSFWFWEESNYSEHYYIDSIIKIPS